MYVALVLVYLGEDGVLVQIAPVFLLPFVVAYIDRIVIPVEESKLAEAFGDAYRRYRARVRRWM
jgi:protein-S-isoprenylcysteine O-methyltransferase Ste14